MQALLLKMYYLQKNKKPTLKNMLQKKNTKK